MRLELAILIMAALVSLSSLFFISKKDWFEAQIVFMFTQLLTWLFGLSVVELRLLEYPYRELSKVNSTSFIFEYLVLPIFCVHFNANYPLYASKIKMLGIYIGSSLSLTMVEVMLERYTAVIKYTGWEWYMTFLSVWLVLWLSRIITQWFFSVNMN